MSLGLVGRKVGMMRLFMEDGVAVPVTVLAVSNSRVAQIKSANLDGYWAVQLAYGERKITRMGRSLRGHLSKAGIPSAGELSEFRLSHEQIGDLQVGDRISVAIFSVGQLVDVRGTSTGKGYAGAIRRHNFSSNRASHGNSISHNAPGSIGMAQDPGRVFPGKRMSGHLGAVNCATQNLRIIRIDEARQLLMLKGAVPGVNGCEVTILPAVKIRTKHGGVN